MYNDTMNLCKLHFPIKVSVREQTSCSIKNMYKYIVTYSSPLVLLKLSKYLILLLDQVFLSMLVRVIALDLPLWHRILVLEVLRVIPIDRTTYSAESCLIFFLLLFRFWSCGFCILKLMTGFLRRSTYLAYSFSEFWPVST